MAFDLPPNSGCQLVENLSVLGIEPNLDGPHAHYRNPCILYCGQPTMNYLYRHAAWEVLGPTGCASKETRMQLHYDSEADALFLRLRAARGGEGGGRRLDETRIAHLDRSGRVFAYEFLSVSRGVSLEGVGSDDAALIRETLQPIRQLAVA